MHIIFMVFWVLANGCHPKKLVTTKNLQAISLQVDWDLQQNEQSELKKFQNSLDIIYYEDYVMYRERIPFMNFGRREAFENNDTVHIIQELIEDTSELKTAYQYFIYRTGTDQGYLYTSEAESEPAAFNVDSILKKKGMKGVSFYDRNDSLVFTEKQSGPFALLQKYVPRSKPDASFCDTSYMYFSENLRNVRYSFSPELDQKMKMKLAKVVFLYNPGDPAKGSRSAGRKLLFEIRQVQIKDPAKIITLFERYKKDTQTK